MSIRPTEMPSLSRLYAVSKNMDLLSCRQLLCKVATRSIPTSSRFPNSLSTKGVGSSKWLELKKFSALPADHTDVPYVSAADTNGNGRTFFLEVYGCQMNFADSEVVRSVLSTNGFEEAKAIESADVILMLTCAIREGAEQKIWRRLNLLKSLRKSRGKSVQIGLLGCMAERLRTQILEREPSVDVIAGPDSYRDLPRLLYIATESGKSAVNVMLSMEESYADIQPVRVNPNAKTAFVSVMRGCDNMCTFCIVPRVRGHERSRPIDSVVDEITRLVDAGVKEVTLLGQNVNSFRDLSESRVGSISGSMSTKLSSAGFSTVYKPKVGGRRFADLLDRVSLISPELRIRFTSPHPKDFPQEVLELIRERPNICRQIHLPAQSGSNSVLDAMGRNYTREAYLELVERMRQILPGLALTSDFIAGFCGESEEDHMDSVNLIHQVKYSFAYCFPYSMREKTKAFRKLTDDVPTQVKLRRAEELISAFRQESLALNQSLIGSIQLVLIEGRSKRSADNMAGRCDSGVKVIVSNGAAEDVNSTSSASKYTLEMREIKVGDYVACEIYEASSQVVKGKPLQVTTLSEFHRCQQQQLNVSQQIDCSHVCHEMSI